MSGQFYEDFDGRIQQSMLAVRLNVRAIAEDMADGYMELMPKEDFIMRIRMALDDLDESELGAMYDEYVKEGDDSSYCEFCCGGNFHHSTECYLGFTNG